VSCFLPPYLLLRLGRLDSLALDETLRLRRESPPRRVLGVAGGPAWVVHDAARGTSLPGRVVRSAGDPDSGDLAVDEAAYGIAGALAMFSEVYGRSSYDGAGATVVATIHYGRDYVNAFWDGTQLVFGDGDGEVFDRFTKPVDVVGHELAHAVTEHTAGLAYQGQSGALNESVSDVFAACLEQRLRGQTATEADWLIGSDLFLPGVQARGLRDMAAPGTAYDDPALGRDPQPDHLDGYVDTTDDNGGVHLNSGIPNRAFQLAAVAIGGSSAEGAGRIWYAALTGGQVGARTDFAGFAAATVAVAGVHADVVREAWATVGVTPASSSAAPGPPAPGGEPARRVVVSRSGGFLGRTTAGEVDLERGDARASELASLVDRVDLRGVGGGPPKPDMYVYDFDLCGARASVPEHRLTADLRRIADLVLGDPTAPDR
jgi:Thermolysin metallopeptidase, alpha-helical domain/Thermolysin metallopeptidase, catalytic domain